MLRVKNRERRFENLRMSKIIEKIKIKGKIKISFNKKKSKLPFLTGQPITSASAISDMVILFSVTLVT